MAGPLRTKVRLLRDKSVGFKSRFHQDIKRPVFERPDIRTSMVQEKIDRGDRIQEARLRRYPSINVDFEKVYAGSVPLDEDMDLDPVENAIFTAGFRNGPFAYVEVTEEFGPDDGSYWLHVITETGKFPVVENRAGLFRRIKDQIHVVVWTDSERKMAHFGAHREQAALLQPARHVLINEADASRGIRDFRNKWEDTFGDTLSTPLE